MAVWIPPEKLHTHTHFFSSLNFLIWKKNVPIEFFESLLSSTNLRLRVAFWNQRENANGRDGEIPPTYVK